MSDTFDKSSVLRLDGFEIDQAKYMKTLIDRIAIRIANEEGSPLYVTPVDSPIIEGISYYDEALAVLKNTPTQLIQYLVPPAKVFELSRITLSGDNIASFTIRIGGATNKVLRTYYGGDLNLVVDYDSYDVDANTSIEVLVTHYNDMGGSFNANIEGNLKNEP